MREVTVAFGTKPTSAKSAFVKLLGDKPTSLRILSYREIFTVAIRDAMGWKAEVALQCGIGRC
jgi:hypothetical protein